PAGARDARCAQQEAEHTQSHSSSLDEAHDQRTGLALELISAGLRQTAAAVEGSRAALLGAARGTVGTRRSRTRNQAVVSSTGDVLAVASQTRLAERLGIAMGHLALNARRDALLLVVYGETVEAAGSGDLGHVIQAHRVHVAVRRAAHARLRLGFELRWRELGIVAQTLGRRGRATVAVAATANHRKHRRGPRSHEHEISSHST